MKPSSPSDQAWSRAAAMLLLLNLLLFAGQLVSGRTTSPPEAEIPEPEVTQLVPSPAPVLHISAWWDGLRALRDLDLVAGTGFHWVKLVFPWRDIEISQGQFDWSRADNILDDAELRDLRVLVRLDQVPYWAKASGTPEVLVNGPPADFQDFEDFCFAVASRYRGRIGAYQVWNEPNLAREWNGTSPDPVEYTRLLAHCYDGIKRGDPEAIVISAGLAPTGTPPPVAMPDEEFVRGMYEAGAAAYFDMLGVNAPGYAAPPQTSPDEVANNPELGGYRWACFRHVEDIREIMLEYDDGHKQVAILEMGWTTDPVHPEYSWFAVTEQQQAEYLAGAYWWARQHWQPWIGFITTIYIADQSWTPEDEQYWWSVNLPNWPETIVRPAYHALVGLPDWSYGFYDE